MNKSPISESVKIMVFCRGFRGWVASLNHSLLEMRSSAKTYQHFTVRDGWRTFPGGSKLEICGNNRRVFVVIQKREIMI